LSKRPLALIVDDDEDLSELLAHSVGTLGFDSHCVGNTKTARDWLGKNVPALVVLDIMMPDGNGLDLCRWIRAESRLAKVPVLMASALKDDETAHDALELGAVDFLRKPFTLEILREKIEKLRR
jgi:DNA-binding response OmpR family regulator